MICPHCSTAVKYNWDQSGAFAKDENNIIGYELVFTTCPNCNEPVIYLEKGKLAQNSGGYGYYVAEEINQELIYPNKQDFKNSSDIPDLYLEDYEEAIKVLSASPKASAALSRRLLQNILREEYEIKERTLVKEIEKFIELSGVPSHLTDAVDAVRNIGNFAAHPTKNQNTGEIVSVENGEAEWLIEVIESLFDFTFIQPKKLERRRKELNLKLEEAGKPQMKTKEE